MWDICIVASESNSKRKSPWSIDRLKCSASIFGLISAVPCSRCTQSEKSKSNYDFCENCSSLDKWSLLKIGLVRWSCQKEVSEFQAISSQSDPSRPEAIYIICFRVTAWLNYFSSVRHMYSCLWKQQQKKKPLINRSTKMQCLNLRLDFSGALQPMYPVRKSKSNYDFWWKLFITW